MLANSRPRPFRVIHGEGAARDAADPAPATVLRADLELVHAVRDGDRAAAVLFHDRLRPIVDRTLGRLIGGRHPDYDDLAQQALVELVLSVERFRGECPLDAWATIVVARLAYKYIRRLRCERNVFAADSNHHPEPVDTTSSGSATLRSAVRRVEKYLRAMDPNKAWALVLHDVHGYDLEEIATILGVSRAAAQSRLVRGRKTLHERIAKDRELASFLNDISGGDEP